MSMSQAKKAIAVADSKNDDAAARARARLARQLIGGAYKPGQKLELREIATEYGLEDESVLKIFADFQALGMATVGGNFSAVVRSPNPKEMLEAYEIRAALEEIAGRTAAGALKGNTGELRRELEGMRAAVREGNLEAYAEHDVRFHRTILESSQNEVLLRVWNTLTLDLRMRAALSNVWKYLPDMGESHQPILDALEHGRGREAALLLRNHVETFLEYLKKAESDSGFRRAYRNDLQGAKDVQQASFPPESFSIPCLLCEVFYQPANELGGDYYDFLSLQSGRWGIAIGDVSGKGIGAALIMASLQASLRAQTLHPYLDLSTLIADVNRLVFESSPTHFFASLFYAEYEPATRALRYVNAGHNPPLVVRPTKDSCQIFQLEAAGMPVGISSELQVTSTAFQLEIGDVLVAYTDGITEAENAAGEFWGQERLEELLRSCGDKTPEQIIKRILEEVSVFAKGQAQRDDITVVVMGVQKGCGVE